MNTKKINYSVLFLSVIGFIIGYVSTNSLVFGLCQHNNYSCRELFNNLGDPLFYGMSALALVSLVLVFIPQAFNSWKKFAIWFIPVSAFIFAVYPNPGAGDLFSPYPEEVYRSISILYVIISLAIIIISSRKSK